VLPKITGFLPAGRPSDQHGGKTMRRVTLMVLFVLLSASLAPADDPIKSFRFTKDEAGKVPAGWKVAKTGTEAGSTWQVVADDTAPSKSGYVLAQTAASPNNVFNLCVVDGPSYKDVELSVAFKAVSGKNDQGGGFVWRYRDADNYYIARMNPLEENYRVYKVVGGKRTQLGREGTKEELKVPTGTWHTLKVTMAGDHIQCFLDGMKQLDVKDSTFAEAGKVGLWTKSDAQTRFDSFQVRGK
jgi:hypothetical protein